MNENPLLEKSLLFAARIIKLYNYLQKEKHETIISKQIIRSGTSIGANANEAAYGVSTADFIAKLHFSLRLDRKTRTVLLACACFLFYFLNLKLLKNRRIEKFSYRNP